MNYVRQQIQLRGQSIDMEIGQFGITSLYARLYLLYQKRMSLKIERKESGGTKVTFEIKKEE